MRPAAARGSSPLTRGKPLVMTPSTSCLRLIPAHAGKTVGRSRGDRNPKAHPRSRGENVRPPRSGSRRAGSSPLTRGKPRCARPSWRSRRLIPAHAGKTERGRHGRARHAAHPRSRGENFTLTVQTRRPVGSSPLTRGKPGNWVVGGKGSGLIPAHAGKTQMHLLTHSRSTAHPRSRGENDYGADRRRARSGSSPLTRGKHPDDGADGGGLGLIPAHAGKTGILRNGRANDTAHPRSRGENSRAWKLSMSGSGSSPLTRGKRGELHPVDLVLRLIPAHAGKTDRLFLIRSK